MLSVTPIMEWSPSPPPPLGVLLPTAVTLDTFLMEGAPGLVRVMGFGVDQLQLALVSLFLSVTKHNITFNSIRWPYIYPWASSDKRVLDSSLIRTCHYHTGWLSILTATPPVITCSDLMPPNNGEISYSGGSTNNRLVSTVVTYSCSTGYTLSGGSTRTCQSDGTWSGSPPTCHCKFLVSHSILWLTHS